MSLAPITLRRLQVRHFRNLTSVDLLPSPRLNVISGDNGQGKTSLLEALYAVATTRSFRADKLKEALQDGGEQAVIAADIRDDGLDHAQRLAFGTRGRSVKLDGKRPERLAAYATRTPVVVFHPGDLTLVSGPASGRRTLLDRVALFLDPSSGEHRVRYTKALRERQVLLEERGVRASGLDAYEQLIARHGAAFSRARALAASRLAAALGPVFTEMAAPDLGLAVRHVPGGVEDATSFARELAERRPADLRRKAATFGPQRDDLDLVLDGRSARRHASQGQQRILTLALKLAELACVREARGAEPILLLDDFSSELDPARTGAVYRFVGARPCQVFVTTTRPELFVTPPSEAAASVPSERADWKVDGGVLTRA